MFPEKRTIVVLLLLSFLLINFSINEEDKYEKWIKEEVNLIITNAEKKEFEKLKKDEDKESFIKLFWARRDPTPKTEKNEFKEEYYKRLEHIKNAFLYGYKMGLETDQGKVYLYFGEPRVFPQGEHEVWIYSTLPWMNIAKESFSFVFSNDGIGYVIDRSLTDVRVMQAFYDYPKKALLYPDLKKLPEYTETMNFSPESFEGDLIQKARSLSEEVMQIPLEISPLFIKAENSSSFLTLLLKVGPYERIESLPNEMIIFGRIESTDYSSDFRQERKTTAEKDYLISQIGFPVRPGAYELFVGFYTPDKESYSIKSRTIEVPDFWNQKLALSSLLASSQVKERKAQDKEAEFTVFSFGRYLLEPCFAHEFSKDDFLNLFYYIYNMSSDENQNCSLLIELELQKGEKRFRLNPQRKSQRIDAGATLAEGTRIPLSALPEPGEYELTVRVTDELANTSASQKFRFKLL
jgi:GWxTD domain-containing protein